MTVGLVLLSLLVGVPDCPFAAHNAYPYLFWGDDFLDQALKADLKHIEVDITYDGGRSAIVVTHDSRPRGTEPILETFLEPVWRKWIDAPGGGFTIILDCKTADPRLATSLVRILDGKRQYLSKLSRRPGGSFVPGKITVALSGNAAAQRAYAHTVSDQGDYLAFGDIGAEEWRADAASYVPSEPAGFIRYLTFERRVFLSRPEALKSEDVSVDRLETVMRLAAEKGYVSRIYTVNATRTLTGINDRYWRACVEANVPLIATDNYGLARRWWDRLVNRLPSGSRPATGKES